MRKILSILCVMLILFPIGTVHAEHTPIERNILLDNAFIMLEKGNLFTRRYNELTGAEVEGLFELGVPYFFGGGKNRHFLANYPEYRQTYPWQEGGGYKMSNLYLVGLDCSGFVNYVYEDSGYERIAPLPELLYKNEHEAYYLYSHREGMSMPDDWAELARNLKIGDLLVAAHPIRHVMMYIGTLGNYGFTREEVPALADYLDYPLIIHSAASPQLHQRFTNLIETNIRYSHSTPPIGGVAVSILGVPLDAGEYLGRVSKNHFYGFRLDEDGKLDLPIWDFDQVDYFAWYRTIL